MKIFISAENLCGFIFFLWLCFMAVAFAAGCVWPGRKKDSQEESDLVDRMIDSLDEDFDV